ncbi:hypothetical protein FG476_11455 [Xylella fastidiosa subsp. multiplex]|uniref:Uncharacterized protein n=1 Tax=Xylella fastidiosa subsp. multiplex TaxID=644357 RepID=A0A9Q4MKJ1_XYLFS|nr:hypothetical protein [Xylella fastidiosa]ACA12653.1 conserved hypothetical protein [Xylella fastidiosa M12]ERI61099.1 hypothetical protein M233_00375 [Xylella fastidiosa subsp. multiplex Griffin-1]KFA41385.1 hypothetical protein DF22_001964 [Xylella fastidiosa]MBE0268222.1 hypothetical protein [Xylella fastidiosa subsp. multiplex]MBE0274845.1 hypothetical protein [Xylella fastidiosa subsp. multiplex]
MDVSDNGIHVFINPILDKVQWLAGAVLSVNVLCCSNALYWDVRIKCVFCAWKMSATGLLRWAVSIG